jgi:3-deoxy-manno-octulosonate cytidylyltransferase (CMP-KDO synthetase)
MNAPSVLAVIPARLGSTRFASKVLYPYRGKPLMYYVWRVVARSRQIDRLVIATDSREVESAARSFGAEVVRTSARHRTGSDRAAEVARKIGGDIIINIQADNLGLQPAPLDRVIVAMKRNPRLEAASLAAPITFDAELYNPNCVKVVVSRTHEALWFSRFPIPYLQHGPQTGRAARHRFFRHVGIYFFRREALLAFGRTPRTAAETAESLEQLRLLEMGRHLRIFPTRMRSVSVDSPQDVAKLDAIYR